MLLQLVVVDANTSANVNESPDAELNAYIPNTDAT